MEILVVLANGVAAFALLMLVRSIARRASHGQQKSTQNLQKSANPSSAYELGDRDLQGNWPDDWIPVRTLRTALREQRRLHITYEDQNGNETDRTVEAYYLDWNHDHLLAWCCLRKEPRTFYGEGIRKWKLLPEHFERDLLVDQWWREEYPRDNQKIPWSRWKEMKKS